MTLVLLVFKCLVALWLSANYSIKSGLFSQTSWSSIILYDLSFLSFPQYKAALQPYSHLVSCALSLKCFPDLLLFWNSHASNLILQLHEIILKCLYLGSQSEKEVSFWALYPAYQLSNINGIYRSCFGNDFVKGLLNTFFLSFDSNLRTCKS